MRSTRSILLTALVGLAVWATWSMPTLAAPALQGETVHVVQVGDTLAHIALHYGVSVADLVAANGLADPDRIAVGQRLVISPAQVAQPHPTTHVVRAGETLYRIALRYSLSLTDLAAANGLTNPNYIVAGQRLTIPSASSASGQLGTQGIGFLASSTDVEIVPSPAVQGQTVAIQVHTDGLPSTTIQGTLLGQELEFIPDPHGSSEQWALVGIPALTEPGQYTLQLTAEGSEAEVWMWLTVVAGDFGIDYIQLSPETSRLLDPKLIQAEWAKLNQHWSRVRPDRLWRRPFGLPVASDSRISSPFGTRRSYNGGPVSSYHEGIDFVVPRGTSVFAAAPGQVVLAEQLTVRGNTVLIDHGWGVVSGYCHLSHIGVQAGQEVAQGDLIGEVGSTGLSTGDHLHWEVRVQSVPVDPRQWMRQSIPSGAGL